MPNIREQIIGWSVQKQTDISTMQTTVIRTNKLNEALYDPKPINEDDADEFGKGHEFGVNLFKSHMAPDPFPVEKYISSEMAAFAACFGLGKVTKTGAGPYNYVVTPLDFVTDGSELPYFTYYEQIRPGGSVVRDLAHIGCVLKSHRYTVNNGPGRQNAKMTMEFLSTGNVDETSGITAPAALALNEISGGAITLTVIGVDYVTPKDLVSVEWGWDTEFIPGFYAGSGTSNGYQIQGRLEIRRRTPILRFVARFKNGSAELTKLLALTTGTAIVGMSRDANNNLQYTYQKVGFRTAEIGSTDEVVTVSVEAFGMYHASNGVLTVDIDSPLSVTI